MDTTSDPATAGGDPACHLHLLCSVCGGVASERRAPCCAPYAGPVRHPWLGVLRTDGEGRMAGGIDVDPAVRPAAADGDTGCRVTIRPGGAGAGAGPADLDDAAARVRRVLGRLESVKDFALAHAPARSPYGAADPTASPDRLFLEGIDVIAPDAMELAFGYGDLGTLLVRVDASGRGLEVRLRA